MFTFNLGCCVDNIDINYAKAAFKHHLTVSIVDKVTLWSWWRLNTMQCVTGVKWGNELPAHHTIISTEQSWVATNPCALVCNICWVSKACLHCSARAAIAAPSLLEGWASSMHQWQQPSSGTCRMPNQWFIRTQLAERHGAPSHMPWGLTTVRTRLRSSLCAAHACCISAVPRGCSLLLSAEVSALYH